jgi:hypothetical protein
VEWKALDLLNLGECLEVIKYLCKPRREGGKAPGEKVSDDRKLPVADSRWRVGCWKDASKRLPCLRTRTTNNPCV